MFPQRTFSRYRQSREACTLLYDNSIRSIPPERMAAHIPVAIGVTSVADLELVDSGCYRPQNPDSAHEQMHERG